VKRANPVRWICPYRKKISQQFFLDMILVFIAEIKSVDIKKAGPLLILPV